MIQLNPLPTSPLAPSAPRSLAAFAGPLDTYAPGTPGGLPPGLVRSAKRTLVVSTVGLAASVFYRPIVYGLSMGLASIGAPGPAFAVLYGGAAMEPLKYVVGGASIIAGGVSAGILIADRAQQKP